MSVKTISQFKKKVRKSLKFDKEVCKSPKIRQNSTQISQNRILARIVGLRQQFYVQVKVVLARKIKKQGRSSTPTDDSSICD